MSKTAPFTFTNPDQATLAIDFGTSNSLLAAADGAAFSKPLPLDPFASDPTVFRTIMYFPHGNLCHYGQKATEEYSEHQAEGRLIRSIKKYLPSETFVGSWIDERMVRLEDLIGYFLLEMRKRACAQLDTDVTRVLLGRPAKFSDDPIKDKLAEHRMRKAAELAGFKHVDFLAEPLAAAFELRQRLTEMKTVLVVDLGGGTSDFTVIRVGPQPFQDQDVLSMGGVSLAGDAIDGDFMRDHVAPFLGSKVKYRVPMGSNILEMPKSLLTHICSPADLAQLRRSEYYQFFQSVRDWALSENDRVCLDRLFTLVEDQLGFQIFEEIDRTKRLLSTQDTAAFKFDYPTAEIDFEIARPDYNASIGGTSERILAVMDETLKAAQLKPADIDLVYCTGGTSKLRLIQGGLRRRFSADKIVGTDFFHSVIQGLSARAMQLAQT